LGGGREEQETSRRDWITETKATRTVMEAGDVTGGRRWGQRSVGKVGEEQINDGVDGVDKGTVVVEDGGRQAGRIRMHWNKKPGSALGAPR